MTDDRQKTIDAIEAELNSEETPGDSLRFALEYLRCTSDWERLTALASELDRIHDVDWQDGQWTTVGFIDNGDVE